MKKVKEEEMGRNEDKVKEKKGGEIENVLLYTTTKELWRYEKKEREEKKGNCFVIFTVAGQL